MFTTLVVQPLFNLLVLIYAIIPGHNFGLAIILFTIVIRLLMWPLLKKQLHQVKLMRKIQPDLKRVKKAAAGDKRKEQLMMMELYKEKGINPFGQIGVLILQIPILLGLYSGLQHVLKNHNEIVNFAYPALQHLSWLEELSTNIHKFDTSLFGIVDLTKAALPSGGGIYWPAMILVAGSAVVQFYQSKQLSPDDGQGRTIRAILREAKEGKQADQAELNAVMSRNIRYLLPIMIFIFTVHLPAALSLYWLVSGIVAFIQQTIILREDVNELEVAADTAVAREKNAIEAEIIPKPKSAKKNRSNSGKKRRRK